MGDVLYISINLKETDDYVEIIDTLSIVDNLFISGLDYKKEPLCIAVTLHKSSPYLKNVSKKMEHEYIEAEQHEYFNYYLSFYDIEDGADKCVEMLSSVFGITRLEQVDIISEGCNRIYSTEKLPPPKSQRNKIDTKRPNKIKSPIKRKKDTEKIGCYFTMACFLFFSGYISYLIIKEVIYYPIKTHMGSYELKEDGTIDISNFTEWSKTTFNADTLPEMKAVYMWCMQEDATLPHKIMRNDPPFRIVKYNGKAFRVLYIGCTNALNQCMADEYLGENDNKLHNYIGTLLGIPKIRDEHYRLTLPKEAKRYILNYMYYNLRLFYWKYYSDLWGHQYGENGEVKELIELLHPPLNIYENYCFDELHDFRELMIATNEKTDLKKAVMEYYKQRHRKQSAN
ncbi:MAG: hypothetical protein J1E37_05995 [Prevotella sp.]|nr:hypothetical protein [Prevotella sp.]